MHRATLETIAGNRAKAAAALADARTRCGKARVATDLFARMVGLD